MTWMRKRAEQGYQALNRVRLFLVALWENYLLPLAPVPVLVAAVVVLGMWLAPDEVPADGCPELLPDTPPASAVPVTLPSSGIVADGVAIGAGYGEPGGQP